MCLPMTPLPCTEHEDGQGWWFGFDCAHAGDMMYDPNADLTTLSPEARTVAETHIVENVLARPEFEV
jgi:hypothetical protein